jgi:hypothetical protein
MKFHQPSLAASWRHPQRERGDGYAPTPLDGIGNALRASYVGPCPAIPDEMAKLLDRLR